MEVSPDELLGLARRLAAEAAVLLREGLERPRTKVETKSTSTDMVTEMDRASERLLVDGIRRERPDDAILAEEGGGGAGSSPVRWVLDPLDGTTNYLYGHPGFNVSIAAEVGGETVAGVVHDVVHDEVFEATRGGGARRNGESIAVSSEAELGAALVATGFG